jgi:curli biogenesis system outer membrane secretion channel CsgG
MAVWCVAGLSSCSIGRDLAVPVSVAVWDFEDLSPNNHANEGMGELLAIQVTAHLDGSGTYQVVDRKDLLRVLQELHLGSSQITETDTRLRLGRIIGAQQMIFGAFQVIGQTMRLDIRCVDVASGRIIKTAMGTAAGDSVSTWLDAADQAAAELIES